MMYSGLSTLLLLHSLKTHQRNYDWRSEYSIFMSGLQVRDRCVEKKRGNVREQEKGCN